MPATWIFSLTIYNKLILKIILLLNTPFNLNSLNYLGNINFNQHVKYNCSLKDAHLSKI